MVSNHVTLAPANFIDVQSELLRVTAQGSDVAVAEKVTIDDDGVGARGEICKSPIPRDLGRGVTFKVRLRRRRPSGRVAFRDDRPYTSKANFNATF